MGAMVPKKGPKKRDTGPGDLVWVDDAADQYGISRATIFRLGLRRFKKRVGDTKTYVRRAELARLLKPKEKE